MAKKSSGLLKMILVIVLVIAVSAVLALIRGRMLVERTYYVPMQPSARAEQPIGESDRPSEKVKIVGLADLHGEMVGDSQERIVRMVREADPDFIVYLGDMVEKSQAEESVESLVVLTEQLV